MNSRFVVMLGFGLALLPLAAAGKSAPPQPSQTQVGQVSHEYSYLLGPSDVVHVEVLNHPDFNIRIPIAADGTIQLPYIGSITAMNMTITALRNRIAEELAQRGVFSNVTIEADIVSYASRYATVLGSVTTPGLVPLDREYHLSEIIARAGGIREGSSNYAILRSATGRERQLSIQDLATGGESSDPVI